MQRLLAGLTVLAVSLGIAAGTAHAATAGRFALDGNFAALTGASTFAATPSCPLGATMNIVAHEDDDLLFLSPDLIHDVQAGRCVRTVFVTAGAFSGDTDYGAQREAGSRAAYALMAGVANSWTTTDAGISGHPIPLLTLAGKPTVSLAFMHLPQSLFSDPGGPTDPLLMNLWNGTITSLRTYDGSSSYTKAQLVSALTSLMTAFQPDTVRTQDYVGTFSDSDHPDHHATAYFARQAHLAYSTSHTFTGYEDYETESQPQNVFGSDLTTKTNAFNTYATYDTACDCASAEYAAWVKRQYVKATESQTTDTTPPTVASVTPANGATNVSLGTSVSATFSEAISSASATTTSFVLRDANGDAVTAAVSASGSTVTLQPNATLAPSTTYTATLLAGSNGIKDQAGNPLASNYSWSFTTAAPDTTPPTVAGVTPANGATNVSLGTSVSATFSEAISSASATTTSFVLRDANGNAVTATISASGSTVTLQPNATLAPSTTYTATLLAGSNGIKDQAGNPLASDYSWSFTTAAGPSCPCSLWAPTATPQTLAQPDTTAYELGVRFESEVAGFITAIRFYKGTGNTGTHVGHLWSSTGTLLASATFTSETATGWQQVSFASPVAISANTAYVASYTDPAGRFSLNRPYFTSAYDSPPLHAMADGDGGPNGLYKEGTGFPTAGSQASNYWVDVVFTTSVVDTTPPTVAVVTPAGGASNVSLGTSVSATFSEPISTASVTSTSFVLRDAGGSTVPATVTASGATATLQPSAALAPSTTYTATLQGGASGITDSSGNALKSDYTWSFTTLAPDTTPPTVAAVTPANGASNVSLGTSASATFSEPISTASVTSTSFVLRDAGGSTVPATVTASGATATLQPSAALASSTTYTATLQGGASGVKDSSGNALASDYTWSFTTAAVDQTPPVSAVAFPADSGVYNAARWDAGCSPSGLCGTASDAGSGVQKIEVSIRRTSTNRYWTGSGYTSTTERWFVATGTTTWSYALASTSFPGAGSYAVRVRATDNGGNVSSPTTTTFVYDNTKPSSTVTFPVASTSYTTTSWNAGCPTPGVCGTASDAVAGVQKVEISIRRGSASYWNGTSFSSASEVFLPATGTTAWSFAFPASNFPANANYTIRVRATDNAGNVQSPSSRQISFTQ